MTGAHVAMREPDAHFDGLNYAQSIKEYVWTREMFKRRESAAETGKRQRFLLLRRERRALKSHAGAGAGRAML